MVHQVRKRQSCDTPISANAALERPPQNAKRCAKVLLGTLQHPWAVSSTPIFGLSLPSVPPPPCISYANVHYYYGPYAYCSLDKGVACAQHIQVPTHT